MIDLSRVNRREIWILGGLVVLTLVGVSVALLHGGKNVPGFSSAAQSTAAPVTLSQIPLRTRVVKVAGGLPAHTRRQVQDQVNLLLTRYVADAFLGDYPSKDFSGAWAAFTSGVQPAAKKDADLLTGQRWSSQTLTVEPGKMVAKVSVLAAKKKPIDATASVSLEFLPQADSGTSAAPFTLVGRFILTRVKGEWQIFGYHISAAGAPAGTGASQ